MISTAYDIGDGTLDIDRMSPAAYASHLARSISDPSTIRVHTLRTYMRAPSVETIRGMIEGHRGKKAPHASRAKDSCFNYNPDNDTGQWTVRAIGMPRQKIAMAVPVEPEPPKIPTDNPFYNRGRIVASLAASVGASLGIDAADLLGKRRQRKLTYPRAIVCKLAVDWGLSRATVGRQMGGRDHSTICHAVNEIFPLAKRDDRLRTVYEAHVAFLHQAKRNGE